ncbi:MAG: phenylalanine--tRNA ligase subunit beta [Candidatus Eremiobacterota bacterium]
MPVIGIPVEMLLERISTRLTREELVEHLQHLGCDVEGYATLRRFRCERCGNLMEITETEHPPVECDRCGADFRQQPEARQESGTSEVIRMELLAVRPDMFEPGGLARVLRNYLGESEEAATYDVEPPTCQVAVDPAMAEPDSFRPCIACAVVRDITLSDDVVKVIMKLQENLHWALGRDRKRASIGVYDLDRLVQGAAFTYGPVGPDERKFVPLGYQDRALTPRQVLEQHPKGKGYAHLLKDHKRYPLLCDSQGQVLSLPPIINSEGTKVTVHTRNFFVDVTGTEERVVNKTLNILVTSLLELDASARLERVSILYADRTVATPDLSPQLVELDPDEVGRTIGVELHREEVMTLLGRMGHSVTRRGSRLRVEVPAYRNDIMHPIDLIEDVAIAYGYHNLVPTLVPTLTVGEEQPFERASDLCRRALTGLGYFEVLTLILSSEEAQYDRMRLPREESHVVIENPISVEQTMVRTSLLPGLLDTFSANTDHEMPQHLFEVGRVSRLADTDTGAREHARVAAGATGPRVDYAAMRSACHALLLELGWSLDVEPEDQPFFLPGRGARVLARRGEQVHRVGVMGEVHPEVLEGYKLGQPVSVFELDLDPLI